MRIPGAALAGLAAALLLVAWTRVFALVLGPSRQTSLIVLAVFVAGTCIGAVARLRLGKRDPATVTGGAQLLLAATVATALPFYAHLPYWLWRWAPAQWSTFQAASFALCALVMLAPALLLGVSLGGRSALLWTVAGAVAGALAGTQWLSSASVCIAVALAASVLAGLRALWSAPIGRARTIAATAAAGFLAVFAFTSAGDWQRMLAHAGTWAEHGAAPDTFEAFVERTLESNVELSRGSDGVHTFVTAFDKRTNARFLKVDGRLVADDTATLAPQLLAGHLAALLHSGPVKTAVVLGAGTGIAAGALLTHASVERVELVEPSPVAVDAARQFAEANHNALGDERLHPGKELAADQKYDAVVVSGPVPLTRELFQRIAGHLAPSGVLVVPVPLDDTDLEHVRLAVRTVRDTFAHGVSWQSGGTLLVVASAEPLTPDIAKIEDAIGGWSVGSDLGRISAHSVPAFLALQSQSDLGQKEFAGEGPLNTDADDRLTLDAQRLLFVHGPRVKQADERGDEKKSDRLALAAWKIERLLTAREAEAIYTALARAGAPEDPAVVLAANDWLRKDGGNTAAKTAVANSALAQGNGKLALELLHEVLETEPPTPALAVSYANAVLLLEEETHTPFLGIPSALSALKAALLGGTTTPDLERALTHFCKGVARDACLQNVEVEARRPEAEPP
jgi:hypothetical protein